MGLFLLRISCDSSALSYAVETVVALRALGSCGSFATACTAIMSRMSKAFECQDRQASLCLRLHILANLGKS